MNIKTKIILTVLITLNIGLVFSRTEPINKEEVIIEMISYDLEALDRAFYDCIFPMKSESPVNYDVCVFGIRI